MPVTPSEVVIIPPINHSDTRSDVQPSIVLPSTCLMMPKIIMTREISVMASPAKVINFNGAMENDVMPSTLKASIFFKGYFDSPFVRARRS